LVLEKRGDAWFGEHQADIKTEIARYSVLVGYVATHFADGECACGSRLFELSLDEAEGAAVRVCAGCATEHAIGDSAEYLAHAQLEACECSCEARHMEITVGVSLHADSEDVRWIYLGCRCPRCGRVAVYGDWKNEFEGYQGLLANV
jgi:hypothetical protein